MGVALTNRSTRRRTLAVAVSALCLAAAACSSTSTTASPSATSALHTEVNDPVGDTVVDGRQSIAPDLVHATADVASDNITFVIQFAPGTLDRQTTRVSVVLDTDRNASTGISQGNGLGADYALDLTANSSQGAITKADPVSCAAHVTCFNPIGSVSITLSTDQMMVVVPLASLGSGDGRLCFQIHSYVLFAPGDAVVFDVMPNNAPACVS